MIRKLFLWSCSIAVLSLGVLAVVSMTVQSQLECLDLDNLTPQEFGLGDDADLADRRASPRLINFVPEFYIAKDAALAYWWNVPRIGETPPKIKGVTLFHYEAGQGTRAYIQASGGSLILTRFVLRTANIPTPKSKTDYLFFSVEKDWTGSIGESCLTYLLSASSEELKSLSEDTTTVHILRIPLWVPFVLIAGYPFTILVLGPLRRRRRRKRNECIHCGYNLTGLPESRCPECGEEI